MLSYGYKIIVGFVFFLFNVLLANAQTEYLVTVDPTTGAVHKIDSIPGIKWLQTTSAYNEATKRYTFVGLLDPPAQSPKYFISLDAQSGNVLYNPPLASADKFVCFKYSRITGNLYGLFRDMPEQYHIAVINPATGTNVPFTSTIPGANVSILFMAMDEISQRIFLFGYEVVASSSVYTAWAINLNTGNITKQALPRYLSGPVYDNATHKIYGLTQRPGPLPSTSIWSVNAVDPITGSYSVITDIPGLPRILAGFHETLNENDHLYFFKAAEQNDSTFLYTTNFLTGNTTKVPTSTNAIQGPDNLVYFRYDNVSGKLYGLFWEAHTITPSNIVDSACRLDLQTRVYPNPFNKILVIEKKPTTCKVTMNIHNIIGQLLIKGKLINDGHNEIQFPNLPNGIYFYEFISNDRVLLSGNILKQ